MPAPHMTPTAEPPGFASPVKLGVNVDHVATLRQARGTNYPDPVAAALVCERAGADQITVHLREDRRHIQDRDLRVLREVLSIPLNFEMAVTAEMLGIAAQLRPPQATLVPEKRMELTTEGGLDVVAHRAQVADAVAALKMHGTFVALFVDPDPAQVEAAAATGADAVELHTGTYAEAGTAIEREHERTRIAVAAEAGARVGLHIACGHGLHYHNVQPLVAIPLLREYNIGHAIVARAVFDGLDRAVRDMRALLGAPSNPPARQGGTHHE